MFMNIDLHFLGTKIANLIINKTQMLEKKLATLFINLSIEEVQNKV